MPPYREDPWQRIVNVGWGGGVIEIGFGGTLTDMTEEHPTTIFGPYTEGTRLRFNPASGPHDVREIFDANPDVLVLEFLNYGIVGFTQPLYIERSFVNLRRLTADGVIKTGEGIGEGSSLITLTYARYQTLPVLTWQPEGSVWETSTGSVESDYREYPFSGPQSPDVTLVTFNAQGFI